MSSIKKRYWAFVMYLDSAPINWRDILTETGLSVCVSPYHDKDINADNTPKKPHYHVILCYEGPTTYKNVKVITDKLNATIPIPLEQVRGYFRYLTHKDNPEKYQYEEKDIISINGFNTADYNELTYSQIKSIIIDIQKFILKYDILEYSDLLDLLLDNELYDMLDVSSNHTILFNSYICSRRNKKNTRN